jgi:hypothetical protein
MNKKLSAGMITAKSRANPSANTTSLPKPD